MKQHLGTGLAALALVAALAGCGGSPGTTSTTAAATPSATSPAPASPGATGSPTAAAAVDLKTETSSAGTIVVDAKGMSVYFFTKDVKDSGTSACTGACLTMWPPVLSTAATPSAEGVSGTLGTIATPDGAKQVTLNGLPLYYYEQDKNPGDILGQGVSDVWYLANPAGEMIKTASTGY
ncbi:COG4315 family predicted lipoprotein [Pseudarthrobacter sp. CCNWLW207]|uniref:COG4315 family predicted lipoprotein n=1 Tax=Pseudarthrobacter sp. CCNWLW207 TaxID=3127468 RepID=UPI003076F9F0